MGSHRFAVATVAPLSTSNTDDYYSIGGNLLLREFDLHTGLQGPPDSISSNYVRFIRASLSPPLRAYCPPQVARARPAANTRDSSSALAISSLLPQIDFIPPNFSFKGHLNFFTFDEFGDSGRDDGIVKLTRVLSCPGERLRNNTVIVGRGNKPSVAIGETASGNHQILVAYGSRGTAPKLTGRFFNSDAEPVGESFVIFDYSAGFNGWATFSTDVIWNPRSKRFIVGFMLKEEPDDLHDCAILNVSVFPSGTSNIAVRRGSCDASRGHPTWVDIDRREETNPEGIYAWYYQSDVGKNIYMMDKYGTPTGGRVWFHEPGESLAIEMDHTPPFAALRGSAQDAPHLPHLPHLLEQATVFKGGGEFRDHYVTALIHTANHNEEHEDRPLEIQTFSTDGRLKSHVAPIRFGGRRLRGIGVLYEHTVYIHSRTLSDTVLLRLTVRPNHDPFLALTKE